MLPDEEQVTCYCLGSDALILRWAGYVARMKDTRTFGFHESWGTSSPAERLLASQEVSCICVAYKSKGKEKDKIIGNMAVIFCHWL
jgi:hypothetical protein